MKSPYATIDVADDDVPNLEDLSYPNWIHSTTKTEKEEDVEPEITESNTLLQRLKILFDSAAPVVLTFFLSISGSFINLIFCGHLSSLSTLSNDSPTPAQIFAAIALANMWANVTYKSIIIGLSGAVETLGSQNNGAKNYKEVGLTLQRSIFVLAITCIPCFLSWHYSGPFFAAMRIEPAVCRVISDYLAIRAWEMPIGVIQTSVEKYLMSVGVMHPPMYGEAHFNLSLILLNFVFLKGDFGFGYKGLGYAWVLSTAASLGTLIAMAYNHPSVQRTLQPINIKEILNISKLYEFFELGLPGMLMLLSEWWSYEILSIFAGLLGTPEVAAQTIILSTAALAYMVPLGTGIATASLVGNALGAGKKQIAIEITHLAFQVIIFLEIFFGILIWLFGSYFVELFTDDVQVLRVADSVMPFLSFFVMADGCNAIGSGVIRGAGKQMVGGITNVISYYLFGLPCSWLLCFRAGWGVRGLMMGLSVGTLCQVFSLVSMIWCCETYVFTSALKLTTSSSSSSSSSSEIATKNPTDGNQSSFHVSTATATHSRATSRSRPSTSFVISEIGDEDDDWIEC